MIIVEHTAIYPSPVPAVFARLADVSGYPAWQADVLDVRRGDGGPVRAGTRLTQVRRIMGRATEVPQTVTELIGDQRIVLQTDPGARPAATQDYAVIATPSGGCRVDFRLQLDGVPWLAERFVRAQLSDQLPEVFSRLGGLLAAGA
jgi:hypothetical protein